MPKTKYSYNAKGRAAAKKAAKRRGKKVSRK
jgi:hypothetical protein